MGALINKNTLEAGRLFQRRALVNHYGMYEYNEEILRYQQQNELYLFISNYEILPSRDGALSSESARHQCDPGSFLRPGVIQKWMEFVVGSCIIPRIISEVFLRVHRFSFLQEKPTSPDSNSHENQLRLIFFPL